MHAIYTLKIYFWKILRINYVSDVDKNKKPIFCLKNIRQATILFIAKIKVVYNNYNVKNNTTELCFFEKKI